MPADAGTGHARWETLRGICAILTKAYRGDMLDIAHGDTGGKVK